MIKLTGTNGAAVYLAPATITSIQEADASSQWHGIRAYVRTFDHRTYEVQQTAAEVNAAMAAAPQPRGIFHDDQDSHA